MTDGLDWLRGELAGDRETLATRTPRDHAVAALDTLLAPGLYGRTTIHACLYAAFYAERGAETTFSIAERPLTAPAWRPRDDLTAALLCVWLVAFLATPLASLPATSWLRALVVAQTLPLALDPLAAVAEVAAGD